MPWARKVIGKRVGAMVTRQCIIARTIPRSGDVAQQRLECERQRVMDRPGTPMPDLGSGPAAVCAMSRTGETVTDLLDPACWPLGPYGVIRGEEGPPRVPMAVIRDLIGHAQPTAIVGRHTGRYLPQTHQFLDGTIFPTSGPDGILQAADRVMHRVATGDEAEAGGITAMGLDLGGSEAQSLKVALGHTGVRVHLLLFAMMRPGQGGARMQLRPLAWL